MILQKNQVILIHDSSAAKTLSSAIILTLIMETIVN